MPIKRLNPKYANQNSTKTRLDWSGCPSLGSKLYHIILLWQLGQSCCMMKHRGVEPAPLGRRHFNDYTPTPHLQALAGTLKLQSNGPLYSNTVIGILAVDGWAITFGTARKDPGGLRHRPDPSSLFAVPFVTAHPLMASVPTSHCAMLHYDCFCCTMCPHCFIIM